MATRPAVIAVICIGFFVILHAMAQQSPSKMARYMIENHRFHKRKNYKVQRERDQEVGTIDNALAYDNEVFGPDLAAVMFSGMKDIFLLDKVETMSHESGNIKVKKVSAGTLDMGDHIFPRKIPTLKCSPENEQTSCRDPFQCEEIMYDVTVLIKNGSVLPDYTFYSNTVKLGEGLNLRWYTMNTPVSVSCICAVNFTRKVPNLNME